MLYRNKSVNSLTSFKYPYNTLIIDNKHQKTTFALHFQELLPPKKAKLQQQIELTKKQCMFSLKLYPSPEDFTWTRFAWFATFSKSAIGVDTVIQFFSLFYIDLVLQITSTQHRPKSCSNRDSNQGLFGSKPTVKQPSSWFTDPSHGIVLEKLFNHWCSHRELNPGLQIKIS